MENTVFFTLGQAAKETGRSKSTIFKALESGRMSYVEKTSAGYKIDPCELFRVFPLGGPVNTKSERYETIGNGNKEQSRTVENTIENDYLRRENELLREQLERERMQADYWRQQATALLTHQTERKPEPEQPKSLLWQKLFGRGS
jgi:hypothetical protein